MKAQCPDDRHLGRGGVFFCTMTRVLKDAGVPHVGTHGIRHRATTDIASAGVPAKVDM
jgi:integrase